MKMLLLAGSFHSRSRSLALLRHVAKGLSEHQVTIPELDQLPFLSEDRLVDKPASVQAFIDQVAAADAILFCTPEYNHSIPAVLKNAIDWASRPAFNSSLKGKPVSIITQAVSAVGGARAQAHLKLVLDSTLSIIHPCHEMMVPEIDKALDADLQLVDAKVARRLQRHVEDFIQFARRLQPD